MKRFTLLIACTLFSVTIGFSQTGFSKITPLTPLSLSAPTKDKPQAKVWNHANKWWCVLSGEAGTKVYRLDGSSWSDILTLNTKSSKPDCCMQGDLVHILFYRGALNASYLYTIKYDAASNSYKLWDQQSSASSIVFPEGSTTATLALDKAGRMWAASNTLNKIKVWWSDAPYVEWSSPVMITSGTSESDICSIIALPGQSEIGIFWSNQNTKKYGFKIHADNGDPAVWSDDEVPASQSAIAGTGGGMADDHINIKVASNGTLYCAAKTDYNRAGLPKIILLVRHPSGVWDDAYPVTMDPEGTQPLLLLNEVKGKLKIVYTTTEDGGDIMYRESSLSNISFSPAITLIRNTGVLYNYSSSTRENYKSEIVILATNVSASPNQAVGVLASDEAPFIPPVITFKPAFQSFPNPFSTNTTISFTLPFSDDYKLVVYNERGMKQAVLNTGHSLPGIKNTVTLKKGSLSTGIYLVTLETTKSRQTIKVLISN